MPTPAIATFGLTKSYRGARGVVDLALEVHEGEVFGFLGPNGAGKTTTIRTLLDFLRPTSGRAEIFGRDCQRDSLAVRRLIGYLPGELELYENLNGRQLLRYVAGVRGDVDAREIDRLAEAIGAEVTRPIRDLSHGNKQKLGLVQAFLGRPPLLILDEPTSGLDPLVQLELQRWIFAAREDGRTVFLSSHVLPEVERLCDRVGIIRAGRLVAVETVAEIKAKAARRVEIRFAEPVPEEAFAGTPGVTQLKIEGTRLCCIAQGNMDALIKAAARFETLDLISHEPGLEETFLALYGTSRSDSV